CFCGDMYTIEQMLQPFLAAAGGALSRTSSTSIQLRLPAAVFSGGKAGGGGQRTIELILSSYHGAYAYRDALLHGFILVFSPVRLAASACSRTNASFEAMTSFCANIPNTPTQILAQPPLAQQTQQIESL